MNNTIKSFSNLVFHAMPVPSIGCIATGTFGTMGHDMTVTGGNHGQMADGVNTFLVEVTDNRGETPKTLVKKNMTRDDLAFYIEHHSRAKKPRKNRRR